MIISKPAKWDLDGESYTQFHIIDGHPSDDDLRDEFYYRCHHEHDCCGCVCSSIRSTRPLSNGRVAVREYGYRNV